MAAHGASNLRASTITPSSEGLRPTFHRHLAALGIYSDGNLIRETPCQASMTRAGSRTASGAEDDAGRDACQPGFDMCERTDAASELESGFFVAFRIASTAAPLTLSPAKAPIGGQRHAAIRTPAPQRLLPVRRIRIVKKSLAPYRRASVGHIGRP